MRPIVNIGIALLVSLLFGSAAAPAAQITISGPAGSGSFGTQFAVLPNGNIAVTDPTGVVSGVGAVYLYTPTGSLISQLTGSSANDNVGYEGITVLSNGNFVVASSEWHDSAGNSVGAVTWISGTLGLNGIVSASNSLVGSSQGDAIGTGVYALTNGNYVVASKHWSDGAIAQVGAATWGNGLGGTVGPVSASNSLVGSAANDLVSNEGIAVLNNGNYVVGSSTWNNGSNTTVGAATWGSGSSGVTGRVSVANSLIGTIRGDRVGYPAIVPLSNGNYVVPAPLWNNGVANAHVGAVTWANGTTGRSGLVQAANSLYGTTTGDQVGYKVVALSNGNYAVGSMYWNAGTPNAAVGAATWGDGSTGATIGSVSVSNSLVGSVTGDRVSYPGIVALSNGNYVVSSIDCSINAVSKAGASTWGNGAGGTHGAVTTANSLYGTSQNDGVGFGVTPLSNGNYVVVSSQWSQGTTNGNYGAVTWGNGNTGVTGAVAATNSMIGSSMGDRIGQEVEALSNGNYVIASYLWQSGGVQLGAVTLRSGAGYSAGGITASNSLVGTVQNDLVQTFITPLSNGSFVAEAQYWNGARGSVSWRSGNASIDPSGVVTAQNSLVGTFANEYLGAIGAPNSAVLNNGITSYPGAVYAISTSPQASQPGSVTLADGRFGAVGTQQSFDTVYGNPFTAITKPQWDALYKHLVIGFPSSNSVVLLSFDEIFAGRFE